MSDLFEMLRSNPYPGRGILLGRTADGAHTVIAYFIMGRSENSRNRVFVETEDGIRTQAFDPSKITDPSLIIYHPVRALPGTVIVTNGDQTDTIADCFRGGIGFVRALRTRAFEPDAPNYTPRISGLAKSDGSYRLSILKSAEGNPASCQRSFFEYDAPVAGFGHFLSTYEGNGNPLPSFCGEPRRVALTSPTAAALASELWQSLDAENKVSLFVQYVSLIDGTKNTTIINKYA